MYEIGQYYKIPCVKTTPRQRIGRGEWMPVIGPLHEDAEIIDFPYPHWHVDWRFASQKQRDRIAYGPFGYDERRLYALLIQHHTCDGQDLLVESAIPTPRRMKCKRRMPPYPMEVARLTFLRKLEAAYAHCTLKNKICPHRGFPLAGVEQHGNVVTCPGHGLRWHLKTGTLVTTG